MIRALGTGLVRVLCSLYPPQFRQELASDLVNAFDRELGAKLREGRRGMAVWLCLRTSAAILKEAAHERVKSLARRHPTSAGQESARLLVGLANDLKLAIRTQTSEPWTTTAIVLTLALGIGATTTVYALFNYAVFRPAPGIADQHELVSVFVAPDHASRHHTTMSDDHLRAVRQMPAFAGLAAHFSDTYPFRGSAEAAPESRRITRVTAGYFELLGVEPVAGRLLRPDEYEQPGGGVAVISEHLWRGRYGADPAVVGSDVFILEKPFTIVGVARDFRGLDNIGDEDIWVPVTAATVLTPDREPAHQRMVGRLEADMTLQAARQQAADDGVSVVVIDEALATELFGREGAVGRQIFRGSVSRGPRPMEVIGVVANSEGRELREEHIAALYRPAGTLTRATIQIRSPLPEAEVAAVMQRVIRGIEPALPVDKVISLRDRVAQMTAQERLLAKLGSILATLAMAIAVAGIYSAVACRVVERTRELGIRMALGASQRAVGLGVLRRVMALAGLGTAAGLALYGWGARFIEAWLYGVSSLDATTLVGAAALLFLAAVAAAWLPARRATRVDPTIAMRAS